MIRSILIGSALCLLATAAARAEAPSQKGYTIQVNAPEAKAGQAAQASVVVKPAAGMHVNQEYPTHITVAYPAGVEGKAGKQKASRLEKTSAQFDVGYTAKDAGQKTINATVNFAVCDDAGTRCDPRKEQVTMTVNVK